MKNSVTTIFISFIFLLSVSSISLAQNISVGFDFGAGSSYIVENFQGKDLINYSPSLTSKALFKYTPLDSYFGVQLQFMHVSTTYDGRTLNNSYYYGEVNSFTTSLILSHLNNQNKWNFGYDFGLGYTFEDYQSNYWNDTQEDLRRFSSITVSGILSFKASERINIKLTPTALWTDPINTFRTENWYNGREDINLLVFLGMEYRLK